jgi:hypothetical protein
MTIKRPPKMSRQILEYASDMGDFTAYGLLESMRGRWGEASVKSRINEMVNRGWLTRLIEGKPRLGTPSCFAITEAGEARLTQIIASEK